jgi:hypothetical protein
MSKKDGNPIEEDSVCPDCGSPLSSIEDALEAQGLIGLAANGDWPDEDVCPRCFDLEEPSTW